MLDDIDWKYHRLDIRAAQGWALNGVSLGGDCWRSHSRLFQAGPSRNNRARIIHRVYVPYTPLSRVAISLGAKGCLRQAGITLSRPDHID